MTDATTPAFPALDDDALQELDTLLHTLREHDEEVPDWEFCDGFLTALACTRRPIDAPEWLPMLLGEGLTHPLYEPLKVFDSAEQQARFVQLAEQRLAQIRHQLDLPVRSLEEADAFQPEVLDTQGAVLMMSPEEQAELEDQPIPSLGQVWALGFMCALESWPEDWAAPRDKETAQMLDSAVQQVMALVEDDLHTPVHNLYDEDGPASTSQQRLDAYAEAIWAVYDLRQIWRSLGPRQETLVRQPQPGRNDPCTCNSGKKFKKCCGA